MVCPDDKPSSQIAQNCPNCGAPRSGYRCEYCGTPFEASDGDSAKKVASSIYEQHFDAMLSVVYDHSKLGKAVIKNDTDR